MKRRFAVGMMAATLLATPAGAQAANGDTLTVNGTCYQSQGGRCKPYLVVSNACGVSWRLIGGTVNAVHAYATNDPYGWSWNGPNVFQNGIGNVYIPDYGYIVQYSNTPSSTRTFSIRYRVDTGGCSLSTING